MFSLAARIAFAPDLFSSAQASLKTELGTITQLKSRERRGNRLIRASAIKGPVSAVMRSFICATVMGYLVFEQVQLFVQLTGIIIDDRNVESGKQFHKALNVHFGEFG